jgi:hypothetical protein
MKIYIATPMYGGNCSGTYVIGLINLIESLKEKGHSIIYDFVMNESLVTRARNTLVNNFLESDADALLFIDSDQGFDGQEVTKMIESGKKFIGAVSPMKGINWEAAINAKKYGQKNLELYSGHFNVNFTKEVKTFTLDEPVEVENVGTGMVFIDREVFNKLSEKCDSYYPHGNNGEFYGSKGKIKEFFKTEVTEDSILLSEDYYFCSLWKKLGKKIYIAPWVQLTHSGTHVFMGNFPRSVLLNQSIEDSLLNTKPTSSS